MAQFVNICCNCFYAVHCTHGLDVWQCRRFPPSGIGEEATFPHTGPGSWCGEYCAKLVEKSRASHNKPSAKRRKAAASHVG